MAKTLAEMSLEELWRLFPVELAEHDGSHSIRFSRERESLAKLLPAGSRISHIGSTAIKNIAAKPITDMLAEVPHGAIFDDVRSALESAGYICMSVSKGRMSFNKGYTPTGYEEEVFHLHLRYFGDNDELYFRDYLSEHADVAAEYAALKKELAVRYRYDRDGYTAAKSDFVKKYTERAKRKYGKRY